MFRHYPQSALAAMTFLLLPSLAAAQGVYLPGAGAVHGGMAGVSTAAPIDALGAVYWNPAAIGRLGHDEVSIGGAFIYPEIYVTSSIPRLDRTVASGTTRSDSGVAAVPSIGLVFKQDPTSPVTFGFGLIALGGGGVNFPGDPNNPILAPTGPLKQFVFGPIFSSMQLLQLNPSISYQVTDRLSVGVGPTVDITMVSFEPAFFAGPNLIRGAPNTFPAATNSRPFWGAGARAGLVYSVTDTLDVGFGYTTEQWLETWQFNARDNVGNPLSLALKATLPAIYSAGVAWKGIDRLTLAADARYFDYANTDLFGTPLTSGGLGWSSAYAVAIGGNYQLTDRVAVRAGYQYNTNPLENSRALFNIQSPAIIQNTVTVGTTVGVTEAISMSLGYAYGFKNTISGGLREIPGEQIALDASSHSLLFNLQVRFGKGDWHKQPCISAIDMAAPPAAAAPQPLASAVPAQGSLAAGLGQAAAR